MRRLYCCLLTACLLLSACSEPAPPNEISQQARPQVKQNQSPGKQILFGDLHVHTTYSMDAFEQGLSFMGGEGAHPPSDACDFARFCSQLDFWSINDHAEFLTPERWRNSKEAIRQCNAVAGDSENPDMVSFIGWEWTQIGPTPAKHYGHKNVLLAELDEELLPPRPIKSSDQRPEFNVEMDTAELLKERVSRLAYDSSNFREHWNYLRFAINTFRTPACDPALSPTALPDDCGETALTPDDLFRRLDHWRSDYLVIPHGNSWGLYTPPGSSWEKQLRGNMHNGAKQTLIEVYSGHGNSEQHRPWRAVDYDSNGQAHCPEATKDYLPCCRRAAQIIREHCPQAESAACDEQAQQAMDNFMAGGSSGYLSLTGISNADWKNCGQCTDCFQPAFNFRPGTSAQAALAVGNFEQQPPRHFRFGFIASSDNHSARPGTGYKEYDRSNMTDTKGHTQRWSQLQQQPEPQTVATRPPSVIKANSSNVFNQERGSSFFYTGGLVGLHSEGRDRKSIWNALQRKEVYGTSGPRILLDFELLKEGQANIAMGGESTQTDNPVFRISASGAFQQKPGCPEFSQQALSPQRLQRLCKNECYHPGDQRLPIVRLEIIRVRSQQQPGEPLQDLIDDPWRIIDCPADGQGCRAEISDPEFNQLQRNTAYYARAIQQATPAINAGGLRCDYDEQGQCIAVNPCHGDFRTEAADNCLADSEHRAWSSPIFIDYLAPTPH